MNWIDWEKVWFIRWVWASLPKKSGVPKRLMHRYIHKDQIRSLAFSKVAPTLISLSNEAPIYTLSKTSGKAASCQIDCGEKGIGGGASPHSFHLPTEWMKYSTGNLHWSTLSFTNASNQPKNSLHFRKPRGRAVVPPSQLPFARPFWLLQWYCSCSIEKGWSRCQYCVSVRSLFLCAEKTNV